MASLQDVHDTCKQIIPCWKTQTRGQQCPPWTKTFLPTPLFPVIQTSPQLRDAVECRMQRQYKQHLGQPLTLPQNNPFSLTTAPPHFFLWDWPTGSRTGWQTPPTKTVAVFFVLFCFFALVESYRISLSLHILKSSGPRVSDHFHKVQHITLEVLQKYGSTGLLPVCLSNKMESL